MDQNALAETLDNHFPSLAKMPDLKKELLLIASIHEFKAGTVILRQGEFIKVLPLMKSGLAKVFKEEPEKGNEVLLYYIKPGESCVMSLTTLMNDEASKVKAVVVEDSEIVLIPADKALYIAMKYPKWNKFIYELFNHKFQELLNVIEILTFSNKEKRLLEYLKKEAQLKAKTTLNTTHQQIAYELGSSREVISRLLKRLEHQGLLELKQGQIRLV